MTAVAFSLFEERGYDEVTVADIAAAAGVVERTVYRNYGTKLQILLGDLSERTEDFVNVLYRQDLALSLVDALTATLTETRPGRDELAADFRRAKIVFASPSLAAQWMGYQRELTGHLAQWISHRVGTPATTVEVRVLASALVAARAVAIEEWVASPETDLLDHARAALAGLRSHPLNTVGHPRE